MRLLIDIGNSRIKAGVAERAGIRGLTPCEWRERNLDAAWGALFGHRAAPSDIWVSNVAGSALADSLMRYAAAHWQCAPQFAEVRANFAGIRTRYERPQQLGIDRWLAALAAYKIAQGAAGVIDAGTALTVDLVTAAGEHLGGLIAPGMALMARSLSHGTAQLSIDKVRAVERFATNTEAAISLGCRDAFAGLLDRVAARWAAENGLIRWFATGGEADLVRDLSPVAVEVVPDLVLQGLAILADHTP